MERTITHSGGGVPTWREERRESAVTWLLAAISLACLCLAGVLALSLLSGGPGKLPSDPPPVVRPPKEESGQSAEPYVPGESNWIHWTPLEPAQPIPQEPELPPVEAPPAEEETQDWMLTLVNPWNAVPEDYEVTLEALSNGQRVDERCYPDLQAMMDACRSEGLSPRICSSYRTQATQERLYQNEIRMMESFGYEGEEAVRQAAMSVAIPGTSEHQLGLAVDIVDAHNQNLDETQEDTAVQQWLMAHSWEYGFILRYPNGKSDVTGIMYEPWHYRYVGRAAAREIYEQGMCLEEYLQGLTQW